MRPLTIGVADTAPAPTRPDTHMRLQSAAQKAGFEGRLLPLAVPAQPAQLALCDSVLLIGLASGTAAAMAGHTRFRDALSQASLPYQVVYSLDEDQLVELIAFNMAVVQSRQMPSRKSARSPWVWACDKCSDPQCEHRLLTDLIQKRQSTG
ncbi:hypothetical protein [Polaromonas sp. YR568]|uniref:hypothetical protein n=1 Tax=Polaromonas sp. YR568 TaxID=1855301 RepID=UPI0031382540